MINEIETQAENPVTNYIVRIGNSARKVIVKH